MVKKVAKIDVMKALLKCFNSKKKGSQHEHDRLAKNDHCNFIPISKTISTVNEVHKMAKVSNKICQ
jgi:hypothetical protein